jgi:hypothetical protein
MNHKDLAARLQAQVSPALWADEAARLGVSVATLQAKVMAACLPQVALRQSAPWPADGSWSQEFDLTLFEVFGIKGKLSFTWNSDTDWKAQLDISPVIFGIPFKTLSYPIDSQHLGFEWEENFLNIAKLRLGYSFGFDKDASGRRYATVRIKGSAAYYDLVAGIWRSADFDVEVIRIPL